MGYNGARIVFNFQNFEYKKDLIYYFDPKLAKLKQSANQVSKKIVTKISFVYAHKRQNKNDYTRSSNNAIFGAWKNSQ